MFDDLQTKDSHRCVPLAGSAAWKSWLRLASRLVVIAVTVASSAAPLRAVTQIVAYLDQSGQRLYVSAEDAELRTVVRRGGVAAGLRLVERRKQSLAGIEYLIESLSRRYGVDPELVRALIEVESGWNPQARSRRGALGLMQLLPETGARFGVHHLFDPQDNITGGIRYLRFLLDRFDGNLTLTLAAYNAGENTVSAYGGIPPYLETQYYVTQVEARYRQSANADGPPPIYATQENGRVVFANY